MQRRDFMKGAAGTAGALAAGGIAVSQLAGPAVAGATWSIADSSTELDDGDVSFVDVALESTVTWDGFDWPVKYIRFSSYIDLPGNDNVSEHTLLDGHLSGELPDGWSDEGDSSGGFGGPGEYVVSYGGDTEGTEGEVHSDVDWRVIGDSAKSIEDPAPWTDELDVGDDGGQTTFTIRKRSVVELLDADQNVISHDAATIETSEDFQVTVQNQQSQSDNQGDGTSSAG